MRKLRHGTSGTSKKEDTPQAVVRPWLQSFTASYLGEGNYMEYDEEMEFQLVGSTEANSLQGKISNESPVGKALIGAKQGDVVDVEMGDSVMQYKVLKIEKNI